FPSAALAMRSCTTAGRPIGPRMFSTMRAPSASDSRAREIVTAFALPCSQRGWSSTRSGRAVATTRTGAFAVAARYAMSSSMFASAQWMSSKTMMTGRLRAMCSANFVAAQYVSWIGNTPVRRPIATLHRPFRPAGDADLAPNGVELVRGDRLRLALEGERLHGLDLDGITDELVGRLADERLHLAGRLLEPRRDVHRITGDETLSGAGVVGHDLAGVHADPVGERRAPARQELLVQPLERALHVPRGAARAQRVVLVQARQPEHRHHRVADELLDRPAVALDDRLHRVEITAEDLAQRLRV